MDFFGFHPLYVVILVALALIIFGPSRLPKMGAQMGRMLREFQAAREGLTQQMREAFEENDEPDFGSSTPVTEEEPGSGPEVATAETSVAVLDPPMEGGNPEEAETAAAPGPTVEGATAGDSETAVVLDPPVEAATTGEPETTAPTGAPVEGTERAEAGAAVASHLPVEGVAAGDADAAAAPQTQVEHVAPGEPEGAAGPLTPVEGSTPGDVETPPASGTPVNGAVGVNAAAGDAHAPEAASEEVEPGVPGQGTPATPVPAVDHSAAGGDEDGRPE